MHIEILTAILAITASGSAEPLAGPAGAVLSLVIGPLKSPLTYVIAVPLATRVIAAWKFDRRESC